MTIGGAAMEDKAFQLLEKMYGELIEFKKETNDRFDRIENEVKKTNFTIEHDIIPKINVLFDGYKQNTDKLVRIEEAVTRHEDIMIRKIK